MDLSEIERNDEKLFDIRKRLANVCWRLSLSLLEEPKFFKYFPRVKAVEGFEDRFLNKIDGRSHKTGIWNILIRIPLGIPD